MQAGSPDSLTKEENEMGGVETHGSGTIGGSWARPNAAQARRLAKKFAQ